MPRPVLPPRLILRRRKGRPPTWVILDERREIGTGAAEKDLRAAEEALETYIAGKRRSTSGPCDPDTALIADVLGDYIEGHQAEVRRPELMKGASLKLGEFFGTKPVSAVTPESCGEYVKWRTQQRDARTRRDRPVGEAHTSVAADAGAPPHLISASTARRELIVLGAAISWAWRHRRLDRPIPVALPKSSEPRDRYLTRDEVARLLRAARALGFRHLCRFILLAVYTGTRHDAILHLQWMRNVTGGWVDLEANVLYRRAEGAVESAKRRKPCPLPPRLLPHLRAWERQGGRFLVEWHGQPIRHLIRSSWESARDLARLGPEVVPHILKHTCATWLLQSGASLQDVAGILGTTEAVVSHTYGHHAQGHLRRVLGAFSKRGA